MYSLDDVVNAINDSKTLLGELKDCYKAASTLENYKKYCPECDERDFKEVTRVYENIDSKMYNEKLDEILVYLDECSEQLKINFDNLCPKSKDIISTKIFSFAQDLERDKIPTKGFPHTYYIDMLNTNQHKIKNFSIDRENLYNICIYNVNDKKD